MFALFSMRFVLGVALWLGLTSRRHSTETEEHTPVIGTHQDSPAYTYNLVNLLCMQKYRPEGLKHISCLIHFHSSQNSGDERKESYRALTFAQFPRTPVNPAELAEAGFFYTGFRDRVKCFSCGLCVENWVVGDDRKDQRWHRTDCEFAAGNDATNVPLPRLFSAFRASVLKQNSPRLQIGEETGMQNRRSESQGSQNQPNHNRAHERHSASAMAAEEQELYPCSDPVNPYMKSRERRLESFSYGVRWASQRLRASIDDLATAGFFFLGEGDRVKCWYCNGGLQNWEYEDNPWTEHAKWFPSCEFLLRAQGSEFVQSIVAQFPNLRRPAPVRKSPLSIPPSLSNIPHTSLNYSSLEPRNVENTMRNFPCTTLAREMGFDTELITEILRKKYEAAGKLHASSEEFFNDLIAHKANKVPTSSTLPPDSQKTNAKEPAGEEREVSQLLELQRLEEERLCKICRREKSDIVIVPCGHMAACSNCIVVLNTCPVCGRRVQDIIKAFRA